MTAQQIAAPLTRLYQGIWHEIEHRRQLRTMRHELSQLDDRMLQDLGISRAQAEFTAGAGAWHSGPRQDS